MSNVRDPIDILRKEHKDGLQYLAKLENAADSIRINGFSAEAFEQIVEVTRFIDTILRQHNEKEEMHLFPLIEHHVTDPPQVLRIEHQELWHVFRELLKAVKDVEEGRIHGSSIKELVQTAKVVVEHLNNHIAKENDIIFPLAKQLLSKEEYQQLRVEIAS
jgi:uncharacterized protein